MARVTLIEKRGGRPCRYQREKHSRQREQPLLSAMRQSILGMFTKQWLEWREKQDEREEMKSEGEKRPFPVAFETTVRVSALL